MLEHKSIATLTVDEARVLLEPEAGKACFGMEPQALPGHGTMRLVDALASVERSVEEWAALLAGLTVPLLDVNSASPVALGRIPGLLPTEVDLLVRARPYFSLADIGQEGADLAVVAERATPYLGHEGYEFVDKPQGRWVKLVPTSAGVIVRHRTGAAIVSVETVLQMTGLHSLAHDPAERVRVCRWEVLEEERAKRLRILKQSEVVDTVAPFLQDIWGQVRLPYPDRLDLALNHERDDAQWEQLLAYFGLLPVQRYAADYGSARVAAHPHDLGALYRALRALVKEPTVRFVEPTYLLVDDE